MSAAQRGCWRWGRVCATGLLGASLLVACDGELGGSDAGVRRDGGGAVDAGPPVDAGSPADAGPGMSDAGARDGGSMDAGPADAGPAPSGPVLYPSGARHSPLTADMAAQLGVVAARGATLDDDALMKVGDSITVSSSFLQCFDGTSVDLDGRPLGATVTRFGGWWSRTSLSATVGWSALSALAGAPSPLEREHSATSARYATLMFGTNDVGFRTTEAFARDVWEIADILLARGTVPLMSTIPPRDDSASANATVPTYNLALRAIASGRGVPLVDFHRELLPLPSHGLAGDGVHPQTFGSGCVLTATGLERGYNVRNLITLEQLERATRAVAGETLDASAPRLGGEGTAADPFVIDALPFAVMGDTRGGDRGVDTYGCSTSDESGPARIYRLEVASAGRLRAAAISNRGVDADVHLLQGSVTAAACVARDNRELVADVTPGTWFVVVDTFVSSTELSGEFLILVSME